MNESALNRLLFRAPLLAGRARPQGVKEHSPGRHTAGPAAGAAEFAAWSGTYANGEIAQAWDVVHADGGLWIVPPDEAAQLLSPSGVDGMRSRGVNFWFTGEAMLVSAVDEVGGDWIELWFERVADEPSR